MYANLFDSAILIYEGSYAKIKAKIVTIANMQLAIPLRVPKAMPILRTLVGVTTMC